MSWWSRNLPWLSRKVMKKHFLSSSHLMLSSWISPPPLRFELSKYRLHSSSCSGPSEGPVTTTVFSSTSRSSCLWFCMMCSAVCHFCSSGRCLCGWCKFCRSEDCELWGPNCGFFPVVTHAHNQSTLILILMNKEKDGKEKLELWLHCTKVRRCSQTPWPEINSTPRYHENHWTVWDQTEVNRDDMLLGYKGNSQPFDTVIWIINHIIVIFKKNVWVCSNRTSHWIKI